MSVRYAILGLLAQRPRHGYELRNAFEAVVGGEETWSVKPAQVYSTLERLDEAGLIAPASESSGDASGRLIGPDGVTEKRVYGLTGAGQEALKEWFATPVQPEHQRDEFFVKLMIALVSGIADPRKVIHVQRIYLFQQMHAATTLRDSYDPREELAQILLLDKSLMHLEADLRWLDMTEARLEDVKRQPLPEPEIRPRGRPRKNA